MCFCLGFACAWLFWGRVRCSALSRGELRVVCDERRETKVKIARAFGHDTRAFVAHVVYGIFWCKHRLKVRIKLFLISELMVLDFLAFSNIFGSKRTSHVAFLSRS